MQWFEIYGGRLRMDKTQLVHQTYLPSGALVASIYAQRRLFDALGDPPLWYRVVAEPMSEGVMLIADTHTADLDEAIEFVWAWLGAVV